MISDTIQYLQQYGQVALFIGFGIFFAAFNLILYWLIRARGNDPIFRTTYECGPESIGTPWVQLNVRFYIFALLFVLFDVETLFIIPWAVAYRSLGLIGLVEMIAFISVLFLGLVYAWRKGALQWE
jgi:NADH:ubiquinone oxidoreductase subunit 3 (subunit A)